MKTINTDLAIQMKNIYKNFGPIKALQNVNLSIKRGSIHALLGENGAGKTTLMNILYGLYSADCGEIYINGKKVDIKNPSTAIENGIGMVHQHFKLVEKFTAAENIMLGKEITNKFGILDVNKFRDSISKIMNQYGIKVDLDAKIENLSVGMQQRVEILKTLYRGADILILDEPTAVLTPQETEELVKTLRDLASAGKTVLIITHKLKEIKASSDFCTIIRKGICIDTVDVKGSSEIELAEKMVGRNVNLVIEKSKANFGKIIFSIDGLNVLKENSKSLKALKNVSLNIRQGEILGIAGVDGNGQKELVNAITGLCKVQSGTIKINGKEIQNKKIKDIIKSKVSVIQEDRLKNAVILDLSVAENSVLEKFSDQPFSKKGILKEKEINKFTDKIIREYNVSPTGCGKSVIKNLSGGNQQKIVIAREIANNPDLLIAVQPTRGLDIGAIEYVHQILIEQRDKGKAILLISQEFDEIMNLSDTISVLYNGEIVGTFSKENADENEIGLLMAGGSNNGKIH